MNNDGSLISSVFFQEKYLRRFSEKNFRTQKNVLAGCKEFFNSSFFSDRHI